MPQLLTTVGRGLLTNLLKQTNPAGSFGRPRYIGMGSGTADGGVTHPLPAITDTILVHEGVTARVAAAMSLLQTGGVGPFTTWRSVATLTVASGDSSIAEVGCFDVTPINTGVLFLRGTFTPVPVQPGDIIVFDIQLTFTE